MGFGTFFFLGGGDYSFLLLLFIDVSVLFFVFALVINLF
jgi:hypothetical protein